MSLRAAVRGWIEGLFAEKPLGRRGEAAAARYLARKGYKIAARGDRTSLGELDLVAVDGKTVVFVEVKTRQSCEEVHPAEAVDEAKQRRLTRLRWPFSNGTGCWSTRPASTSWPSPGPTAAAARTSSISRTPSRRSAGGSSTREPRAGRPTYTAGPTR